MGLFSHTTIACVRCGIDICLSHNRIEDLKRSHEPFYCPSGHKQWFTGPTKDQKRIEGLKKKIEELEKYLANSREHTNILHRRLTEKNQELRFKYGCLYAKCDYRSPERSKVRRHMRTCKKGKSV